MRQLEQAPQSWLVPRPSRVLRPWELQQGRLGCLVISQRGQDTPVLLLGIPTSSFFLSRLGRDGRLGRDLSYTYRSARDMVRLPSQELTNQLEQELARRRPS